MNRQLNSFRFCWFAVAALALMLAGGRLLAVGPAETRAWETAVKRFQDAKGPTMLGMVETNFAVFTKKYPTSEYYAEAVVFEARALFQQEKYDGVIALLGSQSTNAGKAADQFEYWTAKSYAKQKNYALAADTFARLVRENPDSDLKLEAIFREADAHAKLEYWPRVIEELREPDGVFQRIAKTNRTDELVVSGLLLLSEAELKQKQYPEAEKTLAGIVTDKLEWERLSLLCRVQLDSGQPEAALLTSTNLLAAAGAKPDLKGKTIFLQGEALERLGQFPEAIQTYEANVNGELPAEWRRQALLRVVELMLRQDQTTNAVQRLNDFLAKQPEEKGRDFERLILAELRLKQYYQAADGTNGAGTNLLQAAEDFQQLIRDFPNSEYLGKAWLNLGWCLSAENKTNESGLAFSNAVEHLSFSEEQALARFKLADIQFQRADFAGAVANYQAIIDQYGSLPNVKNDLFEQALYQIVRSSLADTKLTQANLSAATNAMGRILDWFPNGALADRSMLLVGQEQTPTEAQAVLAGFMTRFTNSPLVPEVELALARTYERQGDWAKAIARYDEWLAAHTNDPALPRAEFSRAWANYKAGNETNAFMLFTNYVAQFASNEVALRLGLPARAQYWVGDYYWRQEDFQKAELSYREIFNRWRESGLAFEAMMQAGRAAMQSQSWQAAITCFTNVSLNTNCPPGLKPRALFAYGDATMRLASATNFVPFQDASKIFAYIANTYSNNPIAAPAWGRSGDCYFQLGATDASQYTNALNAYAQVTNTPSALADISTRSMAEIQLGQTLELMALEPSADHGTLQKEALEHFINILYDSNLRENEQADLYCVKEAGVEAAKLAEGMGEWAQAIQFYNRLKQRVPSLTAALDKKINKAEEKLTPVKN